MKVLKLIGTRLLVSVGVFLVVSLIIFGAAEIGPGDAASRMLGRESTEAQREVLRHRLGLDRPATERYLHWLGGAVRGDFGNAVTNPKPVAEIIGPRLRNTVILAAVAFALYVPVTLLLAILSAAFQYRSLDHVISLLTLIGLSIPEFVLGTSLLIIFVLIVPLVPAVSIIDRADSFSDYARTLALPATVLTVSMSVYAVRMLRDSLIEVLQADYIQMAVLRGIPRRGVLLRHALPNTLLPVLNVTALNLTYLFGGVVIVEVVFQYPGLGSLMVEAISLRDAPLIEATVLIPSAVYIAANLAADVAGILLTPRLRTA